MNQGTFEKVHGNRMDDAGLDERRETVSPSTDRKLTKVDWRRGDMTDAGLDE